jgi:hypothetical protein
MVRRSGQSFVITSRPVVSYCNLDSAKKIGQARRVFAVFKRFGRATTLFLWLVGAFVLAELVGRLVSNVFVLSIDNLVGRELSPLRWANGPLIYDDKLGWRLKPRGQHGGQGRPDGKLSIGALGLRGGPYEMRRIPREAILAVGETPTLGVNVDDSETWPAQLAALLQQPVLNGSTWSWGLDQIVLRAEELLPTLLPKTLLVALRPESVAETSYKTFGLGYKPYFNIVDGKLRLEGVPVPKMSARARDIGGPQSVLGYSHIINSLMRTGIGTWISTKTSGANWVDRARLLQRAHAADQSSEIACLLMERLAELRRRYGVRVVVILAYSEGELRTTQASEHVPPVLACAQARGFETLDSYHALTTILASDRARFRNLWQGEGDSYGPPTPEGNAFMAALVHKVLASAPFQARPLEPRVQAQ